MKDTEISHGRRPCAPRNSWNGSHLDDQPSHGTRSQGAMSLPSSKSATDASGGVLAARDQGTEAVAPRQGNPWRSRWSGG